MILGFQANLLTQWGLRLLSVREDLIVLTHQSILASQLHPCRQRCPSVLVVLLILEDPAILGDLEVQQDQRLQSDPHYLCHPYFPAIPLDQCFLYCLYFHVVRTDRLRL